MSVFLTWPALIFFAWLIGYLAAALLIPRILREERIDMPPAGVALMLLILMAWPIVALATAIGKAKSRGRC